MKNISIAKTYRETRSKAVTRLPQRKTIPTRLTSPRVRGEVEAEGFG